MYEDMHYYKVCLKPVSNKQVNFKETTLPEDEQNPNIAPADKRTVEDFLRKKIMDFAESVKNSVNNPKIIEEASIDIGKNTISFDMYAKEEIPILGRSVRSFSQSVLESKYFEDLLVQNKLFKTFVPAAAPQDDNKVVDVSEVETKELVKALVDTLMIPESRQTKEVKEALKTMKSIAIESGILKL